MCDTFVLRHDCIIKRLRRKPTPSRISDILLLEIYVSTRRPSAMAYSSSLSADSSTSARRKLPSVWRSSFGLANSTSLPASRTICERGMSLSACYKAALKVEDARSCLSP
jgi:hypothetical protein